MFPIDLSPGLLGPSGWRVHASVLVAILAACSSESPPPSTPAAIDLGQERDAAMLAPPMCMETETTSCGKAPEPSAPDAPVADETVWRVPVGAEDPVIGAPDALVTIVVFSDFECPYCRRAAHALAEVRAKHPQTVRVVWKDFPLPMHDRAEAAALFARAVRAAKGDAGFWKAHDLLFARQPDFSDDDLREMAEELGVDWDMITKAMTSRTHAGPVLRSQHLGDAVDLRSTPTSFVNGRKVVGARALARLDSLIAEERTRAERLLEDGVPRAELYEHLVHDGHQVEGTSDLP